MTAADREHRRFCLADKVTKLIEYRRLVIIEIAQRAAEHDRVRRKTFRGRGGFRKVRDFSCRALNQTGNVVENILNRHAGDESLASHLGGECLAPFGARHRRQVALVAQQVVDYEHTRLVDALVDGLVATEVLLVKWEGKRSSGGVFLSHSDVVNSISSFRQDLQDSS